MSAHYIYKIRVDTDASGSSNVWVVDACAVDQMVVTLVTEYTACAQTYVKDTRPLARYYIVVYIVLCPNSFALMRKIQGHLSGSHIICWH